jgi:hypothetical protein
MHMYEVVFVNLTHIDKLYKDKKQPQELPSSVIVITITSHYLFDYLYRRSIETLAATTPGIGYLNKSVEIITNHLT